MMISEKRLRRLESFNKEMRRIDDLELISEIRRQRREIKALKLIVTMQRNQLDITRCNLKPNDDNFKLKDAGKV